MQDLRIMVAVPTHATHPAMFTYDLANMMSFTTANLMGGEGAPIGSMALAFVAGTYVHSARQQLAELALEQQADFILWLDSDMRFPKDLLARLLLHNEDLVGINYSTRGVPPDFVAIKTMVPAQKCVTRPDSTGLEEVEAIGFGATLMRTAILRRLHLPTSEKGPWFFFRWRQDIQSMVGEDVYFCELARKAGVAIKVDHDLSKDCAHIGDLEYKLDHALTQYPLEEDDGTDDVR